MRNAAKELNGLVNGEGGIVEGRGGYSSNLLWSSKSTAAERSVFEEDLADMDSGTITLDANINCFRYPPVRRLVARPPSSHWKEDKLSSWLVDETPEKVGVGSTVFLVDDPNISGTHAYEMKGILGATKGRISFIAWPLANEQLPPIMVFVPISAARLPLHIRLLHWICHFALSEDNYILNNWNKE